MFISLPLRFFFSFFVFFARSLSWITRPFVSFLSLSLSFPHLISFFKHHQRDRTRISYLINYSVSVHVYKVMRCKSIISIWRGDLTHFCTHANNRIIKLKLICTALLKGLGACVCPLKKCTYSTNK